MHVSPDVIFLNSVFGAGSRSTLALRRAGLARVPVVLAPEGEFNAGALAQKPRRKQVFLTVARHLRAFDGIQWLARDKAEVAHIERVAGTLAHPALVPCLDPVTALPVPAAIAKTPGSVRLLYLSRVTPKKNLRLLIDVLRDVDGDVDLAVVGPVDDAPYWTSCLEAARMLPPHVRMRYLGECPPAEVAEHLGRAHVLVLPTLGENYAYVIAEALSAGRPVLVSDLTPWRNLEAAGAGWDVALAPARWSAALRAIVAMADADYQALSAGAARRARDAPRACDIEIRTLRVLEDAVRGGLTHRRARR